MNGRLADKVAWVSGAASGMGAAIARLFAQEGASVVLADVQDAKGEAIAEAIRGAGGEAMFTRCDVADEASVKASVNHAAQQFGGLHIVVNCAGIVQVKQLHELDVRSWDRLMDINVKSIFLSTKYAIPHLNKQSRSYIVNIGSVGSFVGQSSTPAYTASKGAVMQLSKSIALDYAKIGLRCNCVCPGITDTPMFREHMDKQPDPAAAIAARLRRVPMGVSLSPDDIAKSVLYFSCEDSAGITGTTLTIDCGYLTAAEWDHGGHTRFMDPETKG